MITYVKDDLFNAPAGSTMKTHAERALKLYNKAK